MRCGTRCRSWLRPDLETAEWVSKSLGDKTVRTKSESVNTGTNADGGTSSGTSTSYGEIGKALLRPEDILTLGNRRAIVFQPYGLAHFVYTVDYWNLQAACKHIQKAYPDMYWPLHYDPNPYHAGQS
ncbi:MAG: type IV secretory system conjugative DNA transfer family protein [Panacagrimonas sp.]